MNESPTWGISGQTFLWCYAVAFVVTAGAVWLRRNSLLNAQDGAKPSKLDVYELAMLNGGPQLAITIATAKLHRVGALVTSSGKKLRTAGPAEERQRRGDRRSRPRGLRRRRALTRDLGAQA